MPSNLVKYVVVHYLDTIEETFNELINQPSPNILFLYNIIRQSNYT